MYHIIIVHVLKKPIRVGLFSKLKTNNNITVNGGELWIYPWDKRILCPCAVCAVRVLSFYILYASYTNDQSLWIFDPYIENEHTVRLDVLLSNGNSVSWRRRSNGEYWRTRLIDLSVIILCTFYNWYHIRYMISLHGIRFRIYFNWNYCSNLKIVVHA